jgi:hypothetical protein
VRWQKQVCRDSGFFSWLAIVPDTDLRVWVVPAPRESGFYRVSVGVENMSPLSLIETRGVTKAKDLGSELVDWILRTNVPTFGTMCPSRYAESPRAAVASTFRDI